MDSITEFLNSFNVAWLVHILVVDFVATLAVLSITYSIACTGFRYTILEHITADEYTQFIASVILGLGIFLNEFYEDPQHRQQGDVSSGYDNRFDYVKGLVLFATIRWTYLVQIRGKLFNPNDSVDLKNKVVIVTGATSGIGLAIAEELARLNHNLTIVIACRDLKKGEQVRREIVETTHTQKQRIVIEEMDMESFDSVRNFVQRISKTFPAVDVLINNAGAMILERRTTKEHGIEAMLQTNCLSSFLLTVLLLPKLRASSLEGGARVVNVSSTTSKIPREVNWADMNAEKYYNMFYTYGHSKFCLNQMTIELGGLLRNVPKVSNNGGSTKTNDEMTTVLVNSCHPGAVRTGVTRHLHWFLQFGANYIISLINKDALRGSQSVLYLATSRKLLKDKRPVTGKYFEHCEMAVIPLLDDAERQKLLRYCEQVTGVVVEDYIK